MEFYLFVGIMLWCMALLEVGCVKINEEILLVVLIALGLISGLRFETGYDWLVYERFLEKVPTLGEIISGNIVNFNDFVGVTDIPMEPLYLLLNILVKSFGGDLQVLIISVSIFNFTILYKFAKKFEYRYIAIAAFWGWVFLSLHMAAIRQSIAISFVLLAFFELNGGNKLKYMLLVMAATGFQYSAIIYIPLYFWITKLAPKSIIYAIFAFMLALYAFRVSAIGYILTAIQYVTPESLADKIEFYKSHLIPERSIGAASYAIFNGCIFAIGLTYIRENLPRTKFNNAMYNLSLIFCSVHLLTAEVPVLWQRLQYIALFGQFSLFFLAIKPYAKSIRVMACVLFGGLTIAFQTWQLSQPLAAPYMPYQSYISYLITGDNGTGRDRAQSYFDDLIDAFQSN